MTLYSNPWRQRWIYENENGRCVVTLSYDLHYEIDGQQFSSWKAMIDYVENELQEKVMDNCKFICGPYV